MPFLNPIWLWGLTGLLIPIGIHLLSRKDGKIIKIGSVRHLEDTNTKQFKSVRLNETLLLAVRCLLITLLVLLLSGFQFDMPGKKISKWLLIEKGLERDVKSVALLSGQLNEFEIKLLASGFPDLKDSLSPRAKINYWNLIEDLKKRPLDQAIILSYNYAEGFIGKRAHLPDHIQWVSKDPDPTEFPVAAVRLSDDSVSLRMGQSNPNETSFIRKDIRAPLGQYFIKSGLDSIAIEASDTISITIVSDSVFAYDKKMIIAAVDVLKQTRIAAIEVKISTPDTYLKKQKTDFIFWLSEKPFDSSDQNHTIQYLLNKNVSAQNLFQRKENLQGNTAWILTKRLNEQIALHEHLTVQLALILFSTKKYKNRIPSFDKRVLPEALVWSKNQDGDKEYKVAKVPASSDKLLALLILLALVIERFVAFKRNS